VAADDQVLRRSDNAPAIALLRAATAGFSQAANWRIHGSALLSADGSSRRSATKARPAWA
jgi:hypothetical protein